MNDYIIDLIIKKINLKIFENNYESSITFDNFIFLYKKKNLDISIDKFNVTGNLKSNIIIYFLGFESPIIIDEKENVNNNIILVKF